MDKVDSKPNDLLRRQRELRGWSQIKVADFLGADAKLVGKWERGLIKPSPYYREKLCLLFDTPADRLGFINASFMEEPQRSSESYSSASYEQAPELGDIMAKYNASRRGFLGAVFTGASIASSGALALVGSDSALHQYEKINEVCWELSNNNQLELAEQFLGIYLPKISAIAHQSSAYQQHAASLVARGYILAAEVDKQNVAAMQTYAQQAVVYSQFSGDHNVQCDALRQEATIALVAKQPFKALQSYQKALPFIDNVTPLLRSRMYLGLASAFARCNPVLYKQEALKYLGLANEHFPTNPENDDWFLYMHASGSLSVLHLYEALTFDDLNQPRDAWKALMRVDGLNPKLAVTDSSRLEFLNLQAKTSAIQGDMEQSCTYLEASVIGADATGYSIWREEAADVYDGLIKIWPHEGQVRRLGKLFQKSA